MSGYTVGEVGAPAHAFRQAARAPPRRHAGVRRRVVPGAAHAPPRGPRGCGVRRRRGVRREAPRRGRRQPPRAPRVAAPRRHIRARVRGRRRRARRLPRPPRRRLLHAQVLALPARHCRPRRLFTVLAYSVVYAHTIIVCNLGGVIAVLEDVAGYSALRRSVELMRGQTHVGLLIFLGSTIGLAFVEGLFEHRVKTLSYGDGTSRLWEGPLLVLMYSFVMLIDSMMSAVFYFTCRSSNLDFLDEEGRSVEELEMMMMAGNSDAIR